MDSATQRILLIVVAVILPPLAVGIKQGMGVSLLINILLTLIFYLPGLIHALIVILR